MRYQQYKKKVILIKRLVIIAIAATTVAGATTGVLLTLKAIDDNKIGDISNVTELQATYTYGESIKISGNTYKSQIVFEFSKEEEESWSTSTPKLVGKYKVRGKSKDAKGGYKYSEVQHFEILPKEIEAYVSQTSIEYGNTHPNIYLPIATGERYDQDYQVNFSAIDEETAKVNIVPESIMIYKGETLINDCYKITYIEKDIEIRPTYLSISFIDERKVYDGKPISADEYQVTTGSLKYEDQIIVSGGKSVSEIGTYDNEHDIKIVNSEGKDVTEMYNLSTRQNTIEIDPISITFRSNNLTKTYDGVPFSEEEYSLSYDESKLLPGHHIDNITFENEYKSSYIAHDSIDNFFTYNILDEEGNDASMYYNPSNQYGKIRIDRRDISFVAEGYDAYFDNQDHILNEINITSGSLASTDEIEISNYLTMRNVDDTNNTPDYVIKHGEEDVTFTCYNINKVSSRALVKPLPLTINIPNGNSFTYDGLQHPIYDPSLSEVTYVGVPENYQTYIGFVDENVNFMKVFNENGYRLNQGDFYFAIEDENGIDQTINFDISWTFGTPGRILKRNAEITTPDYHKIWDAKTIKESVESDSDFTNSIVATGLVDNEGISFSCQTTDSNAGEGSIICGYSVISNVTGENVTSSYNLTINDGHYEIDKRSVTMHSHCNPITYNKSTDITNSVYFTMDDLDLNSDLYFNYDKNYKTYISSPNVGSYSFEVDSRAIIVTSEFGDATDNLIINLINDGVCEVIKRNVSVSQIKDFSYYNLEAHGIHNNTDFEITGLCVGDRLVQDGNDFIEPGDYYYYSDFSSLFNPVVLDENNNDVSSNYNVIYNCDSFDEELGKWYYHYEIQKKHIITQSNPIGKPYDGRAISLSTEWIEYYLEGSVSLDEGDKVVKSLIEQQTPTFVEDNEDPNKNTFYYDIKVVDKNGNDVSNKYEITKNYGQLYINPLTISVIVDKATKTYDSKPIAIGTGTFIVTTTKDKGVYSRTSIPNGYQITCTISGEDLSQSYRVGTYQLDTEISGFNSLNNLPARVLYRGNIINDEPEYDENVTITINSQQMKYVINKTDLEITTNTIRMNYSGKAAPENRKITSGTLKGSDKLYFGNEEFKQNTKYYVSVTDKIERGTYTNEIGPYKILRGSVDVTNCYNIKIKQGTVTIV